MSLAIIKATFPAIFSLGCDLGWASLVLAAVGVEEAHEYGIAFALVIVGTISLVFSAFHWKGNPDSKNLDFAGRFVVILFAVVLLCFGCIWVYGQKDNQPWSRFPRYWTLLRHSGDKGADNAATETQTRPPTAQHAAVPSDIKPLTRKDLQAALEAIRDEDLANHANLASQIQDGVIASIQSSLIAFGNGSCSMFMTSYVKTGSAYTTPIVFLVWMRIYSKLDYSVQIDSYSMDVSLSTAGPWIATHYVPLGGGPFYTIDNSLRDTNTQAFRRAFAMVSSGTGILLNQGSVYALSTNQDSDCLKKVSLVRLVTLEDQLKAGLTPHGIADGWTAFNPSASQRALLLSGSRIFFRLRLHTTAGEFTDYGEFHSLVNSPDAVTGSTTINMVKLGDSSTDLTSQEIRYLGP